MARDSGTEWRVLVLTASGADSRAIERVLERDAIALRVCPGAEALAREIRAGAGAAIVTEEAIEGDLSLVAGALGSQPKWSDLPLVLLSLGERDPSAIVGRLWEIAQTRVNVLERPVRSAQLLAVVHAALQSRARQYQVRNELLLRREVERALRESEGRFRAMADGLPLIVWLHDAEGRQEFVNLALCEYFGVARDEMQGERWELLVHPDETASYRGEFLACVRQRRPFHAEARVRRADGEWRWVESWAQPRFTPEGAYLGHVGASADITDRKRAEEALQEKTAALEEADRRKDLFLATLGHELRNPLAALDLTLKLLEEGTRDAARLRRGMSAQVEQLSRLVDDLLEVSRITRGKVRIRKAPTDLVEIMQRAAKTVEGDVRERKQELVLSLPARMVVEGDATRLEQIFSNLLSNASRYTPEAGRIEVTGRREDGETVIAVRDTGQGLGKDQLEVMFEPFVQADPLGGGLGIGLTLVKGLVELHGGRVEAESEGPGHGAVFSVRLPVGDIGERPVKRRHGSVRRLARPFRVLVVDDNRDFADSLALLLERMGAETLCAYTGADALEKARTWHPEAMLVDIGLPDMTGYEVSKSIRSAGGEEGLLLLAVTGFGTEEAEARASGAGFDGRLVKPIDFEKLYGLLQEWSAKRTPPQPGRVAPS